MDEEIEITRRSEDGEEVFEYHSSGSRPVNPLKAKLIFWAMIIGGIAVGTVMFLFFVTLFIYVGLPLLAIFSIWLAYQHWKLRKFR